MRYRRTGGYLPLSAYGLIGDCRSSALVGEDGSIDWLCLPRFDDPSLFGRILDARKGGHWQIRAAGAVFEQQRYRDLSNVVENIFRTPTGRVLVTDFMPLDGDRAAQLAGPTPEPRLVRLVVCVGGEVTVVNDLHPAPDYARDRGAGFRAEGARFHADAGDLHICVRCTEDLDGPRTEHHLSAGEMIAFALSATASGTCPTDSWTVERARDLLRGTLEYWWVWGGRVRYDGPYTYPVHRSALALKLMAYAPTGAIVAAPTTSLPEQVGGPRNWDYRYTWLRDAAFTLYAFFQLGLTEEAERFFHWLASTRIGGPGRSLDNFYTVAGDRVPPEAALSHLSGYRGSRPVRVGNAAATQVQLDVYGELLDSAYLYARFGGRITLSLWHELRHVVELAIDNWELPDASIWEVRGPVQHFTYSKMMCWVAVDRGLRIAEKFGLPHDPERWRHARHIIHQRVVGHGWSETLGSFTQTLGGNTLDAALLRLSQVRFLDDHDPRMRSTMEAIARDLRDGMLVRRYIAADTDDGLRGGEGAFLACSFWLADSLAHVGDIEEAQRLFEQLLCFASPIGLLSEEADPRTGLLLGNHPQAFTHLALIGAAVNIERARHRRLAPRGLHRGSRTAGP